METKICMITGASHNGQDDRAVDDIHLKDLMMSILLTVLHNTKAVDLYKSIPKSHDYGNSIRNGSGELIW
jgi:hypothetical protein